MKKLIVTLTLALVAFAPAAIADDVTYVAGMTGVTWGGCKKSVSSAFSTLPGYKSIQFEKGENNTQTVTVVTDGSEEVTKEQAVESLGDNATRFVVVTWDTAEDDS